MKVLEFRNITRKEAFIYYRREFKALAVIEYISRMATKEIEFIIENKPLGGYDIHIELLEDVEYPLIPLVKNLKDYITYLAREGSLP